MTEPVQAPCCPQLEPCEPCDTLHIQYRLLYPTTVRERIVPVEVLLRFELRRCPGPLALGPLVYTITLLPGERVRLATSDRHSRFSVDSSSQLAYHHSASAEESFYMAGMAQSASELSQVDSSRRASSYHESAMSGGGSAGVDLGIFEIGGSVAGSSFDASSVHSAVHSFTQHARTSHSHVESGVRASSSVSVGFVSERNHAEGQSQDHYESSSRVFVNPNRCRALTYLFHQIVKCQTVTFGLEAIEVRVIDAQAPTGAIPKAPRPLTGVSVVAQAVPTTSAALVKIEADAREAARARSAETSSTPALAALAALAADGFDAATRQLAVDAVIAQLAEEGLLDADGQVSQAARERYRWDRSLTLPTPGVQVRGCLDECDTCEPELHRKIELELQRMDLENQLLARRIELMATDQDHRCCPQEQPETDQARTVGRSGKST